MLASPPLDDKNNLISESPPIHQGWSTYCICRLPFFQSATFLDICVRVHKAQTDQALMLDGEPPAKQKHWISHEIGNKVVPKLHACIRASQSLMQGQRLHQQETSALGHRLSSIQTKLDTILQHLKTPPHLSSSDQSPFSHEDDVKLVGVPVTPSSSLPSPPPSHDWFKLSYNPVKNSKGFARKKPPTQKVINHPFSSGNNISALDYWNEFYHGSPGKAALNVLEEAYGSTWRSDSKFKRLDGKKGTALKPAWSLQKPIYDYMDLLMNTHPEDVAVAMIQEVFDLFPYKHSKRPNLAKCKKDFFCRWGPLHSIISILGNIAPTGETMDESMEEMADDDGNSSGLV
jgi:hypothetical protein